MTLPLPFTYQPKQAACGAGLMLPIVTVFMGLLLSIFAVDVANYYVHHTQMQTATDGAALAGTYRLFSAGDADPRTLDDTALEDAIEIGNSNLGFSNIDSDGVTVGTFNFETGVFDTIADYTKYPLSLGYNALEVLASSNSEGGTGIQLIVGNVFKGLSKPVAQTIAYAAYNPYIAKLTNGGLRPIYACQAQFNLAAADGNLENNVVRVYGDTFYLDGNAQSCPLPGPGNWGFADLRDNASSAPSNSVLSDWWVNGFSGSVAAGNDYSTQSGNSIGSNGVKSALEMLRDTKTVITIPLISAFHGSGSNTDVTVSSFTGFVITSFRTNGPANSLYIEGYFTPAVCNNQCEVGNATPGGLAKLRLVRPGQAYHATPT